MRASKGAGLPLAVNPPFGPGWMHEIKHDGYRLILRRDSTTVRLFTRRGHDWTDRYPAIASAAAKLRSRSFTLDSEAVVTGEDGVAVFDALHRRDKAKDAMLYAFDLLEFNGQDPLRRKVGPRPAWCCASALGRVAVRREALPYPSADQGPFRQSQQPRCCIASLSTHNSGCITGRGA
jgi:hypothetical protein